MNHGHAAELGIYGALAEFDAPESVVAAAERAYAEGYRKMEAYSPMPVDGLAEAIGFRRNNMAAIVFLAGSLGCLTAFLLQWYTAAVDYPIIVAGKPYLSWPSFIPIMFELTVLFGAFAGVFGMLGLNGLPRPYHPVFNAARFSSASRDGFFLMIQADDPQFEIDRTRRFLESLSTKSITEVEP